MEDKEPITPEVVPEDDSTAEKTLLLPHHAMPDTLYIIPISARPFFPAQVQPLIVTRDKWEETVTLAEKTPQKYVGVSYVKTRDISKIDKDSFPEIGCVVKLINVVKDDGTIQFIAQGVQRFRIIRVLNDKPPYLVQVEYPKSPDDDRGQLKAYAMSIINTIKELLPLNPLYSEELKQYLNRFSPDEPSALADFGAAITTATGDELQDALETVPILRRMEKVLLLLRKELEVVKLQTEISEEVNKKIDKSQREFFLREQLKIIQKELGMQKDDRTADVELFTERLKDLNVPDHVQERFDDEIKKLSILETGSSEYGVTRNYLDWITSLPWGVYSEDKLDLEHADDTLNKDHAGLDDVKERILEFLAVGIYRGEIAGSILLLAGPPGVGKTSIGKSIADALGRKFYRFSLGGMRDEAEIKGHRRTYVGALPGKFVQALRETKVSNPVIMLDEVDKIGSSYQGDPASALLEALDPEQNSEFLDHYFDLRVDLSKVLFVCTANQLDTIPGPLRDRMDIIRLSGYIAEEKMAIAKNHLWPRLLKKNKLVSKQLKLTDAALKLLIEGYAREAGVRNLEKLLNKIVRKAVVKILKGEKKTISVSVKVLEEYLGHPIFRKEKPIRGVGVVTGLAWTSMGGATLPVEATKVHEKNRGFKLTGKLGDVMRESAEIAHSYISSNVLKYGGEKEFFEKSFIHLHVPEGATPKDGPSAGVTMATSLVSLASNRKINRSLAMTGELTLTGKVLPVGGIREKVIAARRIKIMELILPYANMRDVDELPEYIKEGVTFHFARTFSDVYKVVFEE